MVKHSVINCGLRPDIVDTVAHFKDELFNNDKSYRSETSHVSF